MCTPTLGCLHVLSSSLATCCHVPVFRSDDNKRLPTQPHAVDDMVSIHNLYCTLYTLQPN